MRTGKERGRERKRERERERERESEQENWERGKGVFLKFDIILRARIKKSIGKTLAKSK